MDDRLTVANMTTEWGGLSGLFPVDRVTHDYARARNFPWVNEVFDGPAMTADAQAHYAVQLTVDLSTVAPCVAGPNNVTVLTPVSQLATRQIAIHKAYLLSCTNGRVADFTAAAAVLRGHHVAPGVEMYIAAASSVVEAESRARGDWQALLESGCRPLPAGCGPCIGLGLGLLKDGEVGISATNRNFKGRMGSTLASGTFSFFLMP